MTNTTTGSPDVAEEIIAALTRAAQAWDRGAAVEDVRTVPGGHSGVTLRATLVDGAAGARDVIVKMAPPGRKPVGRHDVLRQATILEAIAGRAGLAVPEIVVRSDGDPNLFAMAYVAGQSAEPVLDGPDLPAEEASRRVCSAARMLAILHRTPADLDCLRDEPVLSLTEELARWHRTMLAVPGELRPKALVLHERLVADLPESLDPVLVHGDYRLGNTLCADGEVKAIIDWEIWSRGDPRVDLGWFRLFCTEGNFPGASTPAVGMPTEAELLAEYESEAGRTMSDMAWFDAFASYKMAAIMGHNLRRHREGRHHDPYQETLVPTILGLVDHGIRVLTAGGGHAR